MRALAWSKTLKTKTLVNTKKIKTIVAIAAVCTLVSSLSFVVGDVATMEWGVWALIGQVACGFAMCWSTDNPAQWGNIKQNLAVFFAVAVPIIGGLILSLIVPWHHGRVIGMGFVIGMAAYTKLIAYFALQNSLLVPCPASSK